MWLAEALTKGFFFPLSFLFFSLSVFPPPSPLLASFHSFSFSLFPSLSFLSFCFFLTFSIFSKDFIYLFLEQGEGREKEGEKHQCVFASHSPPTGDLACIRGTCPDQKLNQRPFGSQASTQSTQLHQPGPFSIF